MEAAVPEPVAGRRTWPLALVLVGLSLAGCSKPPSEMEVLSEQRGCIRCHGVVRKFVGPGFAEIAARYRGDAEAAARLALKIRQGSVGTWGAVIMPRQMHVSEAEAQALAAWILAQPGSAP